MKGVARLAVKSFRFMAKTTFPCVDLKVESPAEVIKEGESRKGVLKFIDEDHFNFIEAVIKHIPCPHLWWKLLDRTKHGRIHTNANHIKVEFYIKHGEYVSEQQLADMLAREIEQMGESICDMDLKEEVEKCC